MLTNKILPLHPLLEPRLAPSLHILILAHDVNEPLAQGRVLARTKTGFHRLSTLVLFIIFALLGDVGLHCWEHVTGCQEREQKDEEE